MEVDDFFKAPVDTRDCDGCQHGLTWHTGARKSIASKEVTLLELGPANDEVKGYRCQFKSGCHCTRYTLGTEVLSFSTEEFLDSAPPHLQQCIDCKHALMWHCDAAKGLRSGEIRLRDVVDTTRSSLPLTITSSITPRTVEIKDPESSCYRCTFKNCECPGYSIGREATGLSAEEFLTRCPSGIQLCVICRHGASGAIRSGDIPLSTLVDGTRAAPIPLEVAPIPQIPGEQISYKCKFKDCSCSSYKLSSSASTMTAEEFLDRASPSDQQCSKCKHGLTWHPDVGKSLRRNSQVMADLRDNELEPPPITKKLTIEPSHSVVPKKLVEPPPDMLCPITQDIMTDPVILPDGHSYEREAILRWLEKHDISPMTSEPLPHKNVIPNVTLRKLIMDWRDKNHHI